MHNSQPHIVRLVDEDFKQSFIAIEGQLILECHSFINAVYIMLIAHYVFDIEYNPRIKDVLYYLQEHMLGLPDPKFRKSANYSSISSAIACYLEKEPEGMDDT